MLNTNAIILKDNKFNKLNGYFSVILKTIIPLLFIFIFFFSCQKKEETTYSNIVLKLPEIKNRFDKVVITMSGYAQLGDTIITIDTINCLNGTFQFKHKFEEIKLVAFELLKEKESVGILNFYKKKDIKNVFGNVFIGNEKILISNYYKEIKLDKDTNIIIVEIEGAKEHELFQIKKITNSLIQKNPKSFAVLHNLFFDKEKYSDKELKSLMNLFSNELKNSVSYNKLNEYLNKKIDLKNNGFSQKFNWFDVNGNNYSFEMALNKKKYALLIFWASWCEPCRAEIPELKKINNIYKNEISLVGLTIDENYSNWKSALEKENMQWLNLSSLPKDANGIKKTYNIFSVPSILLLDSKGKIVDEELNSLARIKKYMQDSNK
jgi:thiol-disulfide isomerase/thioredoxin